MLLLGVYPKEMKSLGQTDICPLMFISSFINNSEDVETTLCPLKDARIKKM